LGLVCLASLASHVLRAVRWQILLKPLSGTKVSLWNSFVAVMYGYAVNVAIPRGGELVRLLTIAKSENLAWAGVLSTLLIDRLLDIALLLLVLGSTLTILPPSITNSMPWLLPGGATLAGVTVVALMALPFMGKIMAKVVAWKPIEKLIPARIEQSLQQLITQFDEGTKSLSNPLAYPIIAALSLAIWLLYWLNYYLVVKALHLDAIVSPLNAWIVFAVGCVGVLIPTPGSIGSVHFLVSQGLMLTAGVDKDQALAFATVLHGLSFILVPCPTALICLAINFYRAPKSPA
jgi:uncharacterized protein (TIRG00374 family)